MVGKLVFFFLITVAAILALLLILVVVFGILAGLLAPFLGSVPISYNFRSIRARWTSTIVAILGIAGTVGVFVAMLSLARGFKATLVASGSPDNALVMRAGSSSEMMGGITLESIKVLQDAPGVARDGNGTPILTQDVVGVIPVPLISTGTDANVQVRGVSPNVLEVRRFVKIVQGRMFHSGLNELVVGKNASKTYQGLTVGNKIDFAGGHWQVVGVFDAGGSAFDSEVWCDSQIFNEVLQRPANIFQSATVHLASPSTFQEFKDAVVSDPRMNVDVYREIDYYAKQSTTMTRLITVLGGLVAFIMAIGAVFGALNTMYSAVAERGREIATMRAVGFSMSNVILSFLFEALLISFLGGIIGCLAVLPLNGLTTSTMNFQTFSNVAFAFKITFDLLVMGVLFALVMGILGGLLPAVRAAIQPVSVALREL
ncbi:MAG TPA: ABC transporter permease [Candidatus Eremiobacteraceae bacterium]|nr:ABC transporter permease [Candidatus Eremiobacteraceae bacterium]